MILHSPVQRCPRLIYNWARLPSESLQQQPLASTPLHNCSPSIPDLATNQEVASSSLAGRASFSISYGNPPRSNRDAVDEFVDQRSPRPFGDRRPRKRTGLLSRGSQVRVLPDAPKLSGRRGHDEIRAAIPPRRVPSEDTAERKAS
jgi:hypothetical protein